MTVKNIYSNLIMFLLFICYHISLSGQCLSSGSRNGGSFSNNNAVGSIGWVNPTNSVTSNSISSSSATMIDSGVTVVTNYLYIKNFGFAIPSNAIICGITVKAEHRQQGADGTNTILADNAVYLLKNSMITGTNHSYPWCWTNYYANIVHGSVSDTWGSTWTAADINSPNFGVAISAKLSSSCCHQNLSADIDHVSVTVFYTIPLPIGINHFQLSTDDNNEVSIYWSTLTENNNEHFIVERSKDAITWEEIDNQAGAGYSNELINYTSKDQHPSPGTSYYRIKQMSMNGDSSYSEMKSITLVENKNLFIKFDPALSTINIITNEPEELKITLLDCSGRLIKTSNTNNDEQHIIIEVGELNSGVYIIVVESATQKKIQKLSI